jgi:hypothetical protein
MVRIENLSCHLINPFFLIRPKNNDVPTTLSAAKLLMCRKPATIENPITHETDFERVINMYVEQLGQDVESKPNSTDIHIDIEKTND